MFLHIDNVIVNSIEEQCNNHTFITNFTLCFFFFIIPMLVKSLLINNTFDRELINNTNYVRKKIYVIMITNIVRKTIFLIFHKI